MVFRALWWSAARGEVCRLLIRLTTGVVIQTGSNTVFGRIANLSSKGAPSLTTLQREILRFVLIIVALALFFATLVTVLWGAWLNREHFGFITSSGAVINFVTVCVAFIPEGLPVRAEP